MWAWEGGGGSRRVELGRVCVHKGEGGVGTRVTKGQCDKKSHVSKG